MKQLYNVQEYKTSHFSKKCRIKQHKLYIQQKRFLCYKYNSFEGCCLFCKVPHSSVGCSASGCAVSLVKVSRVCFVTCFAVALGKTFILLRLFTFLFHVVIVCLVQGGEWKGECLTWLS
jgi:hypothetical protein